MLMLGKFTFLFDHAHRIPVLGSSREPVRFHLWVSLGVAALAAVGVERLGAARRGLAPRRADPGRRARRALDPDHDLHLHAGLDRAEPMDHAVSPRPLSLAGPRADAGRAPDVPAGGAGLVGRADRRARRPTRLGARDGPRSCRSWSSPTSWARTGTTSPRSTPATGPSRPRRSGGSRSDPGFIRVFGIADKASGEPGYASEPIDFLAVRDPLDWSLPLVWHLPSSKGNTPMISRRLFDFGDPPGTSRSFPWRIDLEGDTHIVTGGALAGSAGRTSGRRGVHPPQSRRPAAGPARGPAGLRRGRARRPSPHLVPAGQPAPRPPGRRGPVAPAPGRARSASGTARIVEDLPERVVVEADPATPGLSRPVRHVRPRLVGDRRRPAGADPARLRRLPRRLSVRRARTRSSSPTARPASSLGLTLSALRGRAGADRLSSSRGVRSPCHRITHPSAGSPVGGRSGSWPWRRSCWPRPSRMAPASHAPNPGGRRTTGARRLACPAGGGTACTPSPGARARRR